MASEPITIPGIAGEVLIRNTGRGGLRVSVDGVDVERVSGHFLLPLAAGGRAKATFGPMAFFDPHPAMIYGKEKYRTGPKTPWWAFLLLFSPLVWAFWGGLQPVLVAVVAVLVNQAVARRDGGWAQKAGLMVLVNFVTFLVLSFLAWVVNR